MHALHFFGPDQRANVGKGLGRVADTQRARRFTQAFSQFAGDFPVGVNPLHRHADLAGMIKTALDELGHCLIQIGIGGDDDRRDAAVFQRAARARRQFRAQIPTDFGAADKTEKGHSGIGDQLLGHGMIFGQQGLQPTFRKACIVENLGQQKCRQRRRFRRFHQHRTTRGNRRPCLMHDQIDRMIERTDRDHRPQRLKMSECQPVFGSGVQRHRDFPAVKLANAARAFVQAIDCPGQLDPGIGIGFATFGNGRGDNRFLALVQQFSRFQ